MALLKQVLQTLLFKLPIKTFKLDKEAIMLELMVQTLQLIIL